MIKRSHSGVQRGTHPIHINVLGAFTFITVRRTRTELEGEGIRGALNARHVYHRRTQ